VILRVERGHHHASHSTHGHDDHEHTDQQEEAVFDPGDMRNMGGMRKTMPVTFWVYLIGSVALAGIFPFAGFWSKDEILAEASDLNVAVYWMLTIAAFFTAFYMGRQIWVVFFGKARHEAAEQAEESPFVITGPLMVLALLSILGGALNLPGVGTFTHWLELTFESYGLHLHHGEFSFLVAGVSTVLALGAIALSWVLYGRNPLTKGQPDPLRKMLGPVYKLWENKYWVDEIYQTIILNPYKVIAQITADLIDWEIWHDWLHDTVIAGTFKFVARITAVNIDLGIIDGIANGLAGGTKTLANSLRRLQTGYVRNYALSVFIGVVVIVGYLILK
jgi:NADH-quinone oxidoreductase subunit L